jgi:hypothetical protein
LKLRPKEVESRAEKTFGIMIKSTVFCSAAQPFWNCEQKRCLSFCHAAKIYGICQQTAILLYRAAKKFGIANKHCYPAVQREILELRAESTAFSQFELFFLTNSKIFCCAAEQNKINLSCVGFVGIFAYHTGLFLSS